MKIYKDFQRWYSNVSDEQKTEYKEICEKRDVRTANRLILYDYSRTKMKEQFFSGVLWDKCNKAMIEKFCDDIQDELIEMIDLPDVDLVYYSDYIKYLANYSFQTDYFKLPEKFGTIDFSKGLFFVGATGCGKTTLLTAYMLVMAKWSSYTHFFSHSMGCTFVPIKVTSREIIVNFRKDGDAGIERYTSLRNPENSYSYSWLKQNHTYSLPNEKSYPVLFIDDLAWGNTSDTQKTYGNNVNVIDEIIKTRYDYNLVTFATSNKRLSETLDDASLDRAKQMFNLVKFDGESFRK